MADPLFLEDGELEKLTGLKRPSAQIAWLRRKGYPHEVNAAGRPVVCREAVYPRQRGEKRWKLDPSTIP